MPAPAAITLSLPAGVPAITIGGNGDTSIGQSVSVTGNALAGSIQFSVTGLAGANLTPKRRCINADGTKGTLYSVAYKPASTEAYVAAGTPISADGIYTMVSDAFECVLTCAAFASAITIEPSVFVG